MSTQQTPGLFQGPEYQGYGYDQPPAYGAKSGVPAAAAQGVVSPAGVHPMMGAGYGAPVTVVNAAPQPVAPSTNVTMVNMAAAPATNTIIVTQAIRPASYMWLSCLVYWFCNLVFGSIAFVLSIASSSAADDNNLQSARKLGKAAMWTALAGILVTIIAIGIIVAILVTAANKETCLENPFQEFCLTSCINDPLQDRCLKHVKSCLEDPFQDRCY